MDGNLFSVHKAMKLCFAFILIVDREVAEITTILKSLWLLTSHLQLDSIDRSAHRASEHGTVIHDCSLSFYTFWSSSDWFHSGLLAVKGHVVPCLWAISLSFLSRFVNYSFKHDWPGDWITGLIDQWARKKECQWPLKPKCDLND